MDLLFRNLSTLISLKPSLSSPTLLKSINKNLFHVPDQRAFQQIVHFLLSAICPMKVKSSYKWPLDIQLDRGCERKFLAGVRCIVMELREEYPQYGIPIFTVSFLSNPSGPKFTCLIIKLSIVALDMQIQDPAFVKLSEEHSAATNPCPDMHVKVFKLELEHQRNKLQQTNSFIANLRLEAAELGRYICLQMKESSNKIKHQETELQAWLANNLVIPAEVKASLVDVKNQQILLDWSAEIKAKYENTAIKDNKLKEFDQRMDAANNTIQAAIELCEADLCLDGSRLRFNVTEATLGLLVPAIQNLQVPLHTNDGTIILSSVALIGNECLKLLIDSMKEEGVLNYLRSFPHSAISEQSLRLTQLSITGNSMLQTLGHLTTSSNQFINATINEYTLTDSDNEWMGLYRLQELTPPPHLDLNLYDVPQESDRVVQEVLGSRLVESTEHEEKLNSICRCKPELTPHKQFFSSSPVRHWINQPQESVKVEIPVTTVKKTIPKASRLPVLCSGSLSGRNPSSITARSRLIYSCKKVNNIVEEEFSALEVNIVKNPKPTAKIVGKSNSSPELSPLATALPPSPEPTPILDNHVGENDPNPPDILKHTFPCRQLEDVLDNPVTCGSLDVVYHGSEFDESQDIEICSVTELVNSGFLSPTESIVNLSAESASCLTPTVSNPSTLDNLIENKTSDIKSKDCSASCTPNGVDKENSTPNKKGKTPSTLERIISRYRRLMKKEVNTSTS